MVESWIFTSDLLLWPGDPVQWRHESSYFRLLFEDCSWSCPLLAGLSPCCHVQPWEGFLGRSHTTLTPATPAWLYPAGIWCSWQSRDHSPRNGQWYPWGHRECFLSLYNHELFWMVLLLWRRVSAAESLLWLPDISLCAPPCFISSLSSMCVYSEVFLMDFFPTNTWEDWRLKGCLDFLSNVVMSLAILSRSKNCCPLCLKAWGCWGTSDLLMASFQLPPHLKKI